MPAALGAARPSGPPRWARPLVYGLLAAISLSAAFEIEAWPLSGFTLVSEVRTGTSAGWELRLVDRRGREHPVDLRRLPRSERSVSWVLGRFPHMSAARRDEVCDAWADDVGATPARLRVYRTRFERGAPDAARTLVSRRLAYECGSGRR